MTRPSALDQLVDDFATIRSWAETSRGLETPEIDTINAIIGDGTNVITAGVKAALRVDFNCNIVGSYLHEFDGVTGSIQLVYATTTYVVGSAPTYTTITGSAPPMISSARYAEDITLTGWTTQLTRGTVLRLSVVSATALTRILATLRIRRLEP